MKKNIIRSAVTVATLVGGVNSSFAQNPPTGPDIDAMAAACNIGPHPQTSKAGYYNSLCKTLQDGEKCLALIKRQINADGTVEPIEDSLMPKAEYCIELFTKELLQQ